MLEKREFANTGKKISVLGLGTVKFGRNQGVKYPNGEGFKLPSDREILEILDLCLENGINLLDTAPAYGTAEQRLGELLGIRRKKFVLISKVGEEFKDGVSNYIFTKEHIEMSVTRSLKRLKTDYLDSVIVHCNKDDLNILQKTPAFEVLAKFKEQGDILSFGASTYSINAGKFAVENSDIVMVAYNLDYSDELPVIEYAKEKGKSVLIKKGLSSGHSKNIGENIQHIIGTKGVTSMIFGSITPKNILTNIRYAYS